MKRAKIGSWLTVVGGILITVVSARVAYAHSGRVFLDFGNVSLQYHYLINQLVNSIGYFLLLSSILVTAGAILSFRKNTSLLSGLISLTACGMSACGGILLWFIPYPPAALYLNVEAYAPLFFLGLIISIAGGTVLKITQNKPITINEWF